MKFLRLPDNLLSVLFEDDDIIAIDKPYGFNAHTNDSKIQHSDFIQDGLIEILEKQREQKLHIIHRLDQTTTGVMIFGKTPEGAKKYADYFFNREVKKTYLFITASHSNEMEFMIDQQILHKARELEAKTRFRFLKRSGPFELWQANPLTGRNHQIRIHAEAAKISILGDPRYGGQDFPFLCLHNRRIEFPNQIVIESKPPVYFENLQLLEDEILSRILFEVDRRLRLFSPSTKPDQCFKWGIVEGNGADFSLDRLGKKLVLNWPREILEETEIKRFSVLSDWMKSPLIIHKPKSQMVLPTGDSALALEAANGWVAKEGVIQYELKRGAGPSSGLPLNQRLQRNWVLNHSKGQSVLNLFSHACGFGVAAALGEAAQVTSVDSSKNFLNWGKRNFELNGLDLNLQPEKFKFLCRDSLVYLKQCLNKGLKYDLIICDAPSFVRGEKGVFKIETDLEKLLRSCLECLNSEGALLFSTVSDRLYIDDIRKAILRVQGEIGLSTLEINCILPALDFELPQERAALKSFLIKL